MLHYIILLRGQLVVFKYAMLDKLVKSLPFHGKDYGFEPRALYVLVPLAQLVRASHS